MPNDNPSATVADLPGAEPLQYESVQPATHFRWVILGLVFLGTTVNYLDRQILSILAPDLRDKYHLFTDAQYGYIQGAFALSYAIGQLISGRWIDWIGTRAGYAISLLAWSCMSMLHVLARTAMGFGIVRVGLGVAESPNFPAAVKTIAEWFPKRERAIAMGVINTGVLLGAILVPVTVPFITVHFGWRAAFIITGILGMSWLVLWLPIYRSPQDHPRVSAGELAHICSDPPEEPVKLRWITLLGYPQAWAFMIGKLITDPLWWFYMTWFANYLNRHHGLNLTKLGPPLFIIYLIASVGSMAGGWLSSAMIHRGWSVNTARKTALLICAVIVTPMVFATRVQSVWMTVLLLGLAVAAHQGFSSNLYTLVSDLFPRAAVGSVSGLGGCCGYGASFFTSILTGLVVERWTHQNYAVLFAIAGSGYLVAFLIIQILSPKLEPANLSELSPPGIGVASA